VRLLAPQLEAEANSIRLELAPSLPPVLADSNQILHVCMHLAGQISARLNPETHSPLFVRTHSQGNFVLVDFSSYDPVAGPSSEPPSYPSLLNSEGGNKPSTLSLSACCRIVEEHGGRLLQPSTPGNTAFRMELQVATNSASRSSLAETNRAAARSSS
jgi:nitrogen-specific signal transduction histidine kinase